MSSEHTVCSEPDTTTRTAGKLRDARADAFQGDLVSGNDSGHGVISGSTLQGPCYELRRCAEIVLHGGQTHGGLISQDVGSYRFSREAYSVGQNSDPTNTVLSSRSLEHEPGHGLHRVHLRGVKRKSDVVVADGQPLVCQRVRESQPEHLSSDASRLRWGAHLGDLEDQGLWSNSEKLAHINVLELRAVWLGLQAFPEAVRNAAVVAMTDNTTVVGYIKNQGGGTHSRILSNLTGQMLDWTQSNQIVLSAKHVPGRLNTRADKLSRAEQLLPGEWSLNTRICSRLWKLWGRPMVDIFATRDNHRLPLFFSPMKDELSIGTDGLSQSWDNMLLYGYPPTSLIACVLKKVEESVDTELILVAPN
jgi:hypothetical protein